MGVEADFQPAAAQHRRQVSRLEELQVQALVQVQVQVQVQAEAPGRGQALVQVWPADLRWQWSGGCRR